MHRWSKFRRTGRNAFVVQQVGNGLRSATVRTRNLSQILTHLHLEGATTRSALGEVTGLTRSAVGALVGELEAVGLVRELPSEPNGSRGRPSPVVDFHDGASGPAVLAFEILVDSMAVAVVGLGCQVLSEHRIARSREQVSAVDTVRDLAGMAQRCVVEAGSPEIIGAGVAVAGLVRRGGEVAVAPNLGWVDVALAELLAAEFADLRSIDVGNEAQLAALAEARRGVAKGFGDLIYISAEVGIGGAVVSAGGPVVGHGGFAGEVGHIPVNPAGRTCACGAIGCWETEVGERALLRRAGMDSDGGRVEVGRLIELAREGDATASEVFRETAGWIGFGLAGLVNVMNPQMVVLGGMYREAFEFVGDVVVDRLATRVLEPLRKVLVVPSSLGADAALLGAAELAFDRMLPDPVRWRTS